MGSSQTLHALASGDNKNMINPDSAKELCKENKSTSQSCAILIRCGFSGQGKVMSLYDAKTKLYIQIPPQRQ